MIRTDRLLLRPFVDGDREHVFKGLSDPAVTRYYGVNYDSLEATQAQMDFFAELERNGTGIWWAIGSPDGQAFYGAGGLNNLSKNTGKRKQVFGFCPNIGGWASCRKPCP